MIQGKLIKEIADELGIAERTVKEFRQQAKERFGAKTCYQLVALYVKSLYE